MITFPFLYRCSIANDVVSNLCARTSFEIIDVSCIVSLKQDLILLDLYLNNFALDSSLYESVKIENQKSFINRQIAIFNFLQSHIHKAEIHVNSSSFFPASLPGKRKVEKVKASFPFNVMLHLTVFTTRESISWPWICSVPLLVNKLLHANASIFWKQFCTFLQNSKITGYISIDVMQIWLSCLLTAAICSAQNRLYCSRVMLDTGNCRFQMFVVKLCLIFFDLWFNHSSKSPTARSTFIMNLAQQKHLENPWHQFIFHSAAWRRGNQ